MADVARGDEIRDLIDRHLTDQLDYRLVDYHRASPSFRALIKAVLVLQPRNPATPSRMPSTRSWLPAASFSTTTGH